MKTETRERYFGNLTVGAQTNLGQITDLYFLTFDGACTAIKSHEPLEERKGGMLMAQIGKKAYSIGDLTLKS